MGRLLTAGAETNDVLAENVTFPVATVAVVFSTANPRSGLRHFRGGPTTGTSFVQGGSTVVSGTTVFFRAYVYIASNLSNVSGVTLLRAITTASTTAVSMSLSADGTTLAGVPFTYGTWVRVEMSAAWNGTTATYAGQVDDQAATLSPADTTTQPSNFKVGFVSSAGTSSTIDIDDIAINDNVGGNQNTWPGEGREVLLLPVSDNAKGTGWTNDAASTTNLFNSVDNTPPIGIADTSSGTGLNQLRNATSNANSNYDANMTSYTAAGINPNDTINLVDPIVATAAPVVTSAKQGTVGLVSNPAITNIALAAGGTSGAFWSGTTAGTYSGGSWKISHGTLTYNPVVTLGTSPVMRITQVTSSTRIAMVSFMGIYVDYTPAVAAQVPYVNPMPQLLAQ